MLTIDGHCDPRFTAVREQFFAELHGARGRGRRGVRVRGRRARGGLLGRPRRRGPHAPVRPRHHRERGLHHQGHGRALRPHAGRARQARSGRAGRALLAGVRGQAGKQDIPVRWLLEPPRGLPAIRPPLPAEALFDWEAMAAALAETAPWWTPGERHGYHAITYGHLVGEVMRRVDGRTVGAFLREEVAGPLGADFFIGVPERARRRAPPRSCPPPPPGDGDDLRTRSSRIPSRVSGRTFLNPPRTAGPGQHPRVARRRDPGRQRPHQRARRGARLRGAGPRRRARRRAPARARHHRARHRGAVPRPRRGADPAHALRHRLHARHAGRHLRLRARPAHLRPPGRAAARSASRTRTRASGSAT